MNPEARQLHDIGRRRAFAIWAAALSVYVLAVFHRSSLGVAGLIAADRFSINATQLAFFTVLQLLVYAAMQIPVGVLLDRYGSRVLLLSGLALMSVGQLSFAFATTFPVAVIDRVLVGAGDAMVFISVIRLVSVWFLVRQAPLVTQLTGQIGQLGAIVAAGPLAWALHTLGWTKTFAIASCVGVVLMVGVALVVKDSPYASQGPVRVKLLALAQSLRVVWGNPGTRLGMWSHFTSQFSVTVFTLLWGYPFLVRGEGLSPREAGLVLMAMTGWVIVSGLTLSVLVARYPFYRSWLVIGVVGLMAAGWATLLLRSTPAPLWQIVIVAFLTASGGPASMVGFDLARTFTPVATLGRANGVVNIGGFTASLLTMALIGVVLDWRAPGGASTYDLGDFRVAMSMQYLFWGLGVVQILRYRHKGLLHLHRHHPGAVEEMRQGRTFVHPGIGDHEGI